jgi:hypothetical protein
VSQPALWEHVARLCGARAAFSRDEAAHDRGAHMGGARIGALARVNSRDSSSGSFSMCGHAWQRPIRSSSARSAGMLSTMRQPIFRMAERGGRFGFHQFTTSLTPGAKRAVPVRLPRAVVATSRAPESSD